LYTGLRLYYKLRPWAATSASRTVTVVAELLVNITAILWAQCARGIHNVHISIDVASWMVGLIVGLVR